VVVLWCALGYMENLVRLNRDCEVQPGWRCVAAALAHERRRLVVEFWLALASAAIVCGRLVCRAWTCYRWDGRPRRRP
jgi:hypothetical protein